MKRIAITSNTSWFIYNFFRSSISEFLSDGLEVVVIAPRDEYSSKLIEHGCFYQEIHLDRSGMNPFCEFTNFISLSRELKRANVDCVVNFTPKMNIYSTFAAKLLGKKVINNVAGLGSIFTDGGLKSLIGKALLRLTQPMADHTVFQNKDDYDLYIQNSYIHKDKASRVNGIGINLKQFQPVDAPDDGVIRFILVARLLKTKGVEIYARAARDIGLMKLDGLRIEFALLGFIDETHPQGIKLPEIQLWHNEGTLNFLGSTDHVESVVKDYDCVVLPSFYREGVPQCLIEAAAMAKPVSYTHLTLPTILLV